MLTLTTVQLARRRYKGSVGDSHEIALSFGPTVVTCHVSCLMSYVGQSNEKCLDVFSNMSNKTNFGISFSGSTMV